MSVIAEAVRHLIAAGVTGDALVTAIADMEAAQKPVRSSAAARQKRYRDSLKERNALRNVTNVDNAVTVDASAYKDNRASAPVCSNGSSLRSEPIITNPPVSPPDEQKPHRKARRKEIKTRIDPHQQPTQADRDFSAREGMDLPTFRHEWAQFRDHHLSEGTLGSDWEAAWRKWVRNWKKWGGARAGPKQIQEKRNPFFKAIEDELSERLEANIGTGDGFGEEADRETGPAFDLDASEYVSH